MKHSTGKPTKAEQDHLDAIHDMPCMCCVIEELNQPSRTEAHHLTDKGTRKLSGGHMAVLPLCGWHHRGDVRGCGALCNPPTIKNATATYGPSLAMSKRQFTGKYGTERELLAQTNADLESRVAA